MKYMLKTTLFSLLTITAFTATPQRVEAEPIYVCAGNDFAKGINNLPSKLCPEACNKASTQNMQYRWNNNWKMVWGAKDFKGNMCPDNKSLCECVF